MYPRMRRHRADDPCLGAKHPRITAGPGPATPEGTVTFRFKSELRSVGRFVCSPRQGPAEAVPLPGHLSRPGSGPASVLRAGQPPPERETSSRPRSPSGLSRARGPNRPPLLRPELHRGVAWGPRGLSSRPTSPSSLPTAMRRPTSTRRASAGRCDCSARPRRVGLGSSAHAFRRSPETPGSSSFRPRRGSLRPMPMTRWTSTRARTGETRLVSTRACRRGRRQPHHLRCRNSRREDGRVPHAREGHSRRR